MAAGCTTAQLSNLNDPVPHIKGQTIHIIRMSLSKVMIEVFFIG
jgi:hypothetical protein